MSKMKMPTIYALFAVLLVMALPAQVPATLNYQGRILQNGQPFEGKGYFVFALYEGPVRRWTNKDLPPGAQLNDPQSAEERDAMELEVRNGVFSVVLGKADMTNNRPLLLEHFYESAETPNRVRANMRMEVWFSPVANQTYKKLSPDIEFASVPFAQVAELARTVADGAVGTAQLANGQVTTEKIAAGAVGSAQLANGQVTTAKLAQGSIIASDVLANGSVTSEKIAAGAVGTAQLANGQVTTEKTAEKVSNALNPPGTIIAYAGAVNDTGVLIEPVPGYLLCNGAVVDSTAQNGKFAALVLAIGKSWGHGGNASASNLANIPDLRGVFLRGLNGGASDDFADPNISDTQRTFRRAGGNIGNRVGSFQRDAFQGHWHDFKRAQGSVHPGWSAGNQFESWHGTDKNSSTYPSAGVVNNPSSDSINGNPRTSSETRPRNAYVNYIIKY